MDQNQLRGVMANGSCCNLELMIFPSECSDFVIETSVEALAKSLAIDKSFFGFIIRILEVILFENLLSICQQKLNNGCWRFVN